MTSCPHGRSDAGLTEQQSSLIGVFSLTHIHATNLALETGVVETLPTTQGYLLVKVKVIVEVLLLVVPYKGGIKP